MGAKRWIVFAGLLAVTVTVLFVRRSFRSSREGRIYVGANLASAGATVHTDWANDFLNICPHVGFVLHEGDADYALLVEWKQDRWSAWEVRRDSALIYRAENRDYK